MPTREVPKFHQVGSDANGHQVHGSPKHIHRWISMAMAVALWVGLFSSGTAYGQFNTGSINGVVTDSQGNAIVGAVVSVTSEATHVVTTVKTNPDGSFIVANLIVGTYEATFEAPGFKKIVATNIGVEAANIVKLDERMQVGTTSSSVEVNGEGTNLETETIADGTTIEQQVVQGAPVVPATGSFRDSTLLVNLTPGASGNYDAVNIAGGRAGAQEVQIDGVPQMWSPLSQTTLVVVHPSFDVITQVLVQPGVPAPEFGRSSGGAVTELTRSGGAQYHGDANIFVRNTALDARAFNVAKVANDHQYEMPISIGGPIRIPHFYNGRDRSFFFFDWDRYWTSTLTPEIFTVPTMAERSGDFSAELAQGEVIYDPTTQNADGVRQPFPNNQLTPTSSIAKQLLSVMPQPTNGALINNYSTYAPNNRVENHYFARIDHNQSKNVSFHGTYRHDAFVGYQPGSDSIWQDVHFDVKVTLWNPWVDWIIKPNLFNHFEAASIHYSNHQSADCAGCFAVPNVPKFNVPGVYPNVGLTQEPVFTFTGYTNAFVGNDQVIGNMTYEYDDNLSWVKGRHNMKFGERYDAFQNNTTNYAGLEGTFAFVAGQTGVGPGQPPAANVGNAMASFELGLANNGTVTKNVPAYYRAKYLSVYAEDSWRITPKLTANYGLRWEMQTPIDDAQGNMSTLDMTLPNSAAGGLPGAMIYAGTGPGRTGSDQFLKTWTKGYGPRVGLAYQLGNNMVVRAGYGILYGPEEYSPSQNGFTLSSTAPAPNGYTPSFSLDSGFPAANLQTAVSVSPTKYNNAAVSYTDPQDGKDNRLQDNQVWQIDVQRTFGRYYLDVGYEGEVGHHIAGGGMPNYEQLPDSDLALGNLLKQTISSSAAAAAGITAPYPGFSPNFTVERALTKFPQFTGITALNYPAGSSSWNGMLIKLQRQYSNGFSFLAAYTWSKEFSNVGFALTSVLLTQDATNPKSGKSIGDLNQPQNLQLTYVYDLPIGKGKAYLNHGLVGYLLSGFGISGNQEYLSGLPIHVTQSGPGAGIGNPVENVSIVPGVPLKLATRSGTNKYNSLYDTTGTSHGTKWLNPAAFVNPAAYTFGNTRYELDHLQQLAILNENLAFYKRTSLGEQRSLEFRCEMFNAFNRMNYGGLDMNMADNTPNGHFGEYTGDYSAYTTGTAVGPRITELEMKINF